MSPGVRPSVPRISGRGSPRSLPTVTPFPPGDGPNMWSYVRFSLIKNTTCLIGNFVSSAAASNASGSPVVMTLGLGSLGVGDDRGSASLVVHAAATSPAIARPAIHRRTRARAGWVLMEAGGESTEGASGRARADGSRVRQYRVGADAAPDHLCLSLDDLGPVLEGDPSVVGPGHLEDPVRALDELHA